MAFRLGGGSAQATSTQPGFHARRRAGRRARPRRLGQLGAFGRRGILRRDVNLPSGASLGTLDPLGIESFVPTTALLTLGGVGFGELTSHSMYYLTTDACTPNFLYQANNAQMIGVPSGIQRTTDYHMVEAIRDRRHSAALGDDDVPHARESIGRASAIPTVPNVTTIAGSYKRLAANVGVVPGVYNGTIGLRYNDGSSRTMSVSVSPAFLSFVGVTTFGMPDFSGVSGWLPTYAVDAGASGTWVVSAAGATPGPACSEGKATYLTTQTGRY